MVKNPPAMREMQFQSLGQGRSSGEGNGNPLQYSCLGNPIDRGAWQAMRSQRVGYNLVTKGDSSIAQMVKNLPAMQETPVQSLGQEDPLEKGMAIHSSIFAQRIPSIEETGGLQPMGSQRVRHD